MHGRLAAQAQNSNSPGRALSDSEPSAARRKGGLPPVRYEVPVTAGVIDKADTPAIEGVAHVVCLGVVEL
jgi:hypothetical protein